MHKLRSGFFITASLALLITGIYLAFTNSIQAPTAAWLEAYPSAAFSLAVVAGFADGLNPCAITALLLFIGALMAIVEQTSDYRERRRARLHVWTVAGAYILGIFLLYFFLGMGFVEVTGLRVLGNTHIFIRLAGFIAVMLGLVMVAEYVFPDNPIKLGMPASLHNLAHKWGRRTTIGAAFGGG
ncbi:MAG: cytochrome c biogenesis protein CcdA, partial [Gammaproteobacteria bacterium]